MSTFSRLDFADRMDEDIIKKMFVYLNKMVTPKKKEIKFIPLRKKYGISDTRTMIRHFDTQKTIESIEYTIRNCQTRQKAHIPRWRKYIEIINKLETNN